MPWLILGTAIVIAALCAAYFTYKICFFSSEKRSNDPFAPMDGVQFQAVQDVMYGSTRIMANTQCVFLKCTASDGTSLSARYYETAPDAPLLIAFHGYRSLALRDCAGAFALGLKMGFNVLAVDQRAHGLSAGKTISFGIRERLDCLDWVRFANAQYSKRPVILSGLSMGAATVLMASDLDLPDNVCCIMADCPYSSPRAIICKVARDMHYPAWLAYPAIRLGAALFGGFNLEKADALRAVQKAKVPVLLIHGEEDYFVPCDMSREILKNCASHCELHTFPNAGHGLSYVIDYKRYEDICLEFFQSIPELKAHFGIN